MTKFSWMDTLIVSFLAYRMFQALWKWATKPHHHQMKRFHRQQTFGGYSEKKKKKVNTGNKINDFIFFDPRLKINAV